MKNNYLNLAGVACFIIALMHLAIILVGPEAYRFFGAGEGMASLAEQGSSYPILITLAITLVFVTWGLYAWSGAGRFRPLPFRKFILIIIASIFIVRGIGGIPMVFILDDPYLNELQEKVVFMIISSTISLAIGMTFVMGLRKDWTNI